MPFLSKGAFFSLDCVRSSTLLLYWQSQISSPSLFDFLNFKQSLQISRYHISKELFEMKKMSSPEKQIP